MSSTLGVLDVLSRLREEFERASTALVAQEDANRGILEQCHHADKESGSSGPICEELRKHKAQLEEDLRVAETRRQDARGRLRRLQKEQARRESTTAQKREAARATADRTIESSKKFRSDTSARLRQIGELRARLREKTGELKRIQEESKELDNEISAKTAARDKVKAEVKSRREALAAAVSTADSIEQENKTMLNRAKTVEKEIDEVRQTQEEMQEIASGLQQKNTVLRNELRNLKRAIAQQNQEGRDAKETAMPPSSASATRSHHPGRRGGGATSRRVRELHLRPSKEYHRPEKGRQARDQSPEETGMAGAGHYYHYAAAPLQQHESPRSQDSQLESMSCRRSWDHRAGSSSSSSSSSVRAPFHTAAETMGMPELRLSSPHPVVRTENNATNPSSFSHHVTDRPSPW